MSTVLLGGNRFVDCDSILAYKGMPLLKIGVNPLRVELVTPDGPPSRPHVRVDPKGASPPDRVRIVATRRSFAVFWDEHALAVATLLDPDTVHLKLDLRPLGINIYDDLDGLHIGQNVFSGNVVSQSAAAISLGD
jgi:hypothetical protein